MNRRLTMAQALVAFLHSQYSARDGKEFRFFRGCFGIFGHGNVAGIVQALEQDSRLPYYLCRNEQAMVHTAAAFAKSTFRMQTLACTTSIGPGATNMVTGAALATINRLPVLLLPGDIFARRNVAPVLQQLESPASQDISVNDCFKPVSPYWDRIQRPEQLLTSLREAMRILTSPSETGAVTLSLPQDVQSEAFDYPEEFFQKRVWAIPRNRCDQSQLKRASDWIRASKKPLIVAGGGVLYSEASAVLAKFAQATGIPVSETQAGKGALPFDHPQEVGAVGVTDSRREYSGSRSRSCSWDWHPLQRFHERVENRVSKSRRPLHQYQCGGIRCLQTRRDPFGRRCQGHSRRTSCGGRGVYR